MDNLSAITKGMNLNFVINKSMNGSWNINIKSCKEIYLLNGETLTEANEYENNGDIEIFFPLHWQKTFGFDSLVVTNEKIQHNKLKKI